MLSFVISAAWAPVEKLAIATAAKIAFLNAFIVLSLFGVTTLLQ
jgi:hypothetical protein